MTKKPECKNVEKITDQIKAVFLKFYFVLFVLFKTDAYLAALCIYAENVSQTTLYISCKLLHSCRKV